MNNKELFEDKAWWQKALLFGFVGFVFVWAIVSEYDWVIITAILVGLGVWTWPAWKPLLFVLVGFWALIAIVAIVMGIVGGIVVYSGWSVKHDELIGGGE